jgi:hypothetical protein
MNESYTLHIIVFIALKNVISEECDMNKSAEQLVSFTLEDDLRTHLTPFAFLTRPPQFW